MEGSCDRSRKTCGRSSRGQSDSSTNSVWWYSSWCCCSSKMPYAPKNGSGHGECKLPSNKPVANDNVRGHIICPSRNNSGKAEEPWGESMASARKRNSKFKPASIFVTLLVAIFAPVFHGWESGAGIAHTFSTMHSAGDSAMQHWLQLLNPSPVMLLEVLNHTPTYRWPGSDWSKCNNCILSWGQSCPI